MTSDAVLAVKFMFTLAVRLLTSIHIPGTNITPLSLIFFVACVVLALNFISRLVGFGSISRGISDARKVDNRES